MKQSNLKNTNQLKDGTFNTLKERYLARRGSETDENSI